MIRKKHADADLKAIYPIESGPCDSKSTKKETKFS